MRDATQIQVEDFSIPGGDPSVMLGLRRKRLASAGPFPAERTLLLMHGATFSSRSLFDAPLGGVSVMDELALAGFDVFALDVRGYGASTRPATMDGPPDGHAPEVRAEVALRDIGAAIDWVRHASGIERLCLLGMSWGGSIAGAHAARRPETIAKLALVAPLWLSDGPKRIDPGGPLGAYRRSDLAKFHDAWLSPAPEAERATLIPRGWFETWVATTLETDPGSGVPGTVRAPSGAVQDVREHWTCGRPIYDPATITAPTLIVHAEWDVDVSLDTARDLFARLTGARYRRWVEIGAGTHMVLAERNRWQALGAITCFLLGEDQPSLPLAPLQNSGVSSTG